jgi:TatD DNase family protein
VLVDSHCHLDLLNLKASGGTLAAVMEHARAQGVSHVLCVSVNLKHFPRVLGLARSEPGVSASAGLHPNERVPQEPSVADLVELAAHPEVVAVGETGLDYYRSSGDLEWQRERFRRHIAAARELDKPLIIHSRDAREDTLRVLREEGADRVGGVMHCFSEDLDTARRAADLGCLISFSGIVTFGGADTLRQVAVTLPLEQILVETDAPWLTPVPHRGRPNQPAFVRHVAEHVAGLRGVGLQQLAEATTANFFRLFPLARRQELAA